MEITELLNLKITYICTNTIKKLLSNRKSIKLQKKVDVLQKLVDRNKLITPVDTSIDDIIAYTKNLKIKYHLHQ